MINKRDLERAIAQCERGDQDYASCQKLATLYEVHDHLYGQAEQTKSTEEAVVGVYGESPFLQSISGAPADQIWSVMDELMSTLEIINPRLYRGVMRKIAE